MMVNIQVADLDGKPQTSISRRNMEVQASLPVRYGQQFRKLTGSAGSPQDRGRPLQPHVIAASDIGEAIDIVDRGNGLHAQLAVFHDGRNVYASLFDNAALAKGRMIDLWI